MILHQIWLGSKLPKHMTTMVESWRDVHPHWEYKLWGEDDVVSLKLQNQVIYDRAERLVKPDAVYQLRADIMRYEILHRFGGWYADTDTTCQRSLDEFEDGNLVAGWELQGKWIGNTVLHSPAGHGGLKAIIASLPRLARKGQTSASRISGPRAITQTLRSRSDVTLLDQNIFYPVAWNEPERSQDHHPDAYVVHHWQHQRNLRGIQWRET